LLIILSLALFGPAGTVAFWQGWVYLLVFLSCATLITLYLWKSDPALLARRLRAGPRAEGEPVQKRILIVAFAAFLSLFIVSSLDHRFSWSAVPLDVVIAGDVSIVLGFAIIFSVFKVNSFAAATIEVMPGQTVSSTGPYAIVRHPLYAGALLMLVGTPLALGSWWALFALIPMTAVLVWRLLDEEKLLVKELPGYCAYCQSVRRRLVPFVW
jgi:protein-S-isoprenylcysteine O-methyltransferase Ste14